MISHLRLFGFVWSVDLVSSETVPFPEASHLLLPFSQSQVSFSLLDLGFLFIYLSIYSIFYFRDLCCYCMLCFPHHYLVMGLWPDKSLLRFLVSSSRHEMEENTEFGAKCGDVFTIDVFFIRIHCNMFWSLQKTNAAIHCFLKTPTWPIFLQSLYCGSPGKTRRNSERMWWGG